MPLNVNSTTALDIVLDGGSFCRRTFAESVEEMSKFILYDRNQLPHPFARIKEFIKLDNNEGCDNMSRARVAGQMMAKTKKNKELSEMINKTQDLFDSVRDLLVDTVNENVNGVALVLGQSVLMPKEIYVFDVPSNEFFKTGASHSESCPVISAKSCLTKLFGHPSRSAVSTDLTPSKISVLIKVPSAVASEYLANQTASTTFRLLSNFAISQRVKSFKIEFTQSPCVSCLGTKLKKFQIFTDQHLTPRVVTHHSCTLSTPSDKDTANCDAPADHQDPFVWLQINQSISAVKYN